MTDELEEVPERRKEDKLLEQKLNNEVVKIENRLRRWLIIGIASMAIIAVTSAFALYGYGYVLGQIQDQRRDACEDTNSRNDKTIERLTQLSDLSVLRAKTPEEKKSALARRELTIGLIDALAPKRDCHKIAPDPGYLPL